MRAFLVTAAAAAGIALGFGAPAALAAAPLKISPIEAVFVPEHLATSYKVEAKTAPGRRLTYTWGLHLVLVDKAGASPLNSPDSHAAVDPACNNAKLPRGIQQTAEDFVWRNHKSEWTWYHGDLGAYPGSTYGCDHRKMGPNGHEGIVSVIVSDGTWVCSEYYVGTNLGTAPLFGEPPHCARLSAKATVTHENGGYRIEIENTGDVPLELIRFDSPDNVRITNIEGPGTIEVIPHGEGFSWHSPGGLAPGAKISFTFDTDDPYAPDEGRLVVSDDGVTEFEGELKGPTPHAPPPTTTTDKKKCKCAVLTVQLDPTLLNKPIPPDAHDFGVGLTWRMTCTGGYGSCLGFIDFNPPEVLAGSIPKPKNGFQLNLTKTTFTCGAPCGKSKQGRYEIKMRSRDQLNVLFGRTLAYTVVLHCGGTTSRVRVSVFVDRNGVLRAHP